MDQTIVAGNRFYLDRQARRESNARSYPRRFPLALKTASGSRVVDVEGRSYLDCLAGAGTLALGHNHPEVIERLKAVLDSGLPLHTLDLATPEKDAFVTELFATLPPALQAEAKIQFCSPSGSDAVEAAIKLAKTATGRQDVVAFLTGERRLVLLGERAGMHYVHPHFSRIAGAPYQFNEMLGCLWRDSLAAHLDEGETGVPLAALLHAGSDGVPVAAALVERSGRPVEDWVERFLDVLLPPVIHLLARYGLGFSAHGQNATLILRDGWPERLALRDFVDDVNVCDEAFPENASMPPELRDILLALPAGFMRHFIQTTLFVCVLRYVSVLLDRRCGFEERRFWQAARRVVERYQARFPELSQRFALFDLFEDTYPVSASTGFGSSPTAMPTTTSGRCRISLARSAILSSPSRDNVRTGRSGILLRSNPTLGELDRA